MLFKATFYQAAFHVLEVEADDAERAEQKARTMFEANPGCAATKARPLVRWAVEEIKNS